MEIKEICKTFNFLGELQSYDVLTSGNINATYHVVCKNGENVNQYILQRINKNVFKNPAGVMYNIVGITDYMKNSCKNSNLLVLDYITSSSDGEPYIIDEMGNFWRARQFVESVSYNTTDDLFIVEETGRAFGEFQYLLDGFDASKLFESIPYFHNTKKRIENLEKTLKFNVNKRKQECQEEIEYILSHKNLAETLVNLLEEDKLPLRVTHNDTKCNNVLFDKNTHKALAIIDLDTIMSGLSAYDFGDGARSICATTFEDETDLNKVKFSLDKFEYFTKGYLTKLKGVLTEMEISTLAISVFIMTLELASRFLQDYINGDTYFKIVYPDHNLRRTKCQIALCKDIYSKLDKMKEIVEKYSK